jgi:transcriptional regulator with XRE-family HTH domain
MTLIEVATFLRKERRRLDLTQSDVAAKSGIPFTNISKYERGKNLSFKQLSRYAQALGYELDAVLVKKPS